MSPNYQQQATIQCHNSTNKKSPANAKGKAQQWCMFESPVKQNLGSPMIATMFFTVARR